MTLGPNETAQEPGRPDSPARSRPVLAAEGLSAWYGPVRAIRDIRIEIPRHRVTALIGPVGSGKSTLLRCLNRMIDLQPEARVEGKVRFNGADILPKDIDPGPVRRRIGMVFPTPNPFPRSIYENVAWGVRIHGNAGDLDTIVENSLRRVGLWDEVKSRLHRSTNELSPGQQQRLCIARTLAVGPEVVLMDEPCSVLDPAATARVEDLIDDLRSEYTIVIVAHNLQQARRVSDMTACLMYDDLRGEIPPGQRSGILAEFSPTARLFTNPLDPRTEAYITGRIG